MPVFALLAGQVIAEKADSNQDLQRLTVERKVLTEQLEHYQRTIDLVHTGNTPPEESSNPALRSLAMEAATLKSRLIEITEQEVTLLQRQITTARVASEKEKMAGEGAQKSAQPDESVEGKPLRSHSVQDSRQQEAENVARLHALLEGYYTELQESARILPTEEEVAVRKAAQQDAENLQRIPYSVDKVRLSGSEGSMALAQISNRLMDPLIPESRRDIAPICLIKTHLFDTLIVSENRSLLPVGKNHYIARVRIQPGDTTLTILTNHWELRLPKHADARDYLVTLYSPVDGESELHVFAIEDLLAHDDAHIPAWLPSDLKIRARAG